jgi:hypothetical protein
MAQIKQVGVGRKSTGTIDGITYYVRGGKTFARSTPNIPSSVYNAPEAKIRQAIFKMVQMHMKLHLNTLRQTITPKSGSSVSNRYYSMNKKGLNAALQTLAEQYVNDVEVTITDVEQAIADYAAEHPKSIVIASKSGYAEVYLTGPWPETITLYANGGDNTVIIIVAKNGTTTTINPNGTSVVIDNGGSGNPSNPSGPSNPTTSVAAPTISGQTPFTNTSEVTLSAESGASVYYTVDGSTPTAESTPYSAPFTLNSTTVVKAIAIKDGVSSEVATKNFTKSSGNQDD